MTNIREVWRFRVDKIEHRFRRHYVGGSGDAAEFAERPLGWFVTCGDVTFSVGTDRPNLRVGDTLELRKREQST